MVEKSLVSRQEAKSRELESKLEFEKTQVKRLEVSVKDRWRRVEEGRGGPRRAEEGRGGPGRPRRRRAGGQTGVRVQERQREGPDVLLHTRISTVVETEKLGKAGEK